MLYLDTFETISTNIINMSVTLYRKIKYKWRIYQILITRSISAFIFVV